MDIALRNRVNDILCRAMNEDWKNRSFSLKKAHVCVLLSSLVYEDVQEYELKQASRIHLFASDTYRGIINSGKANPILSTLEEGKFDARFFVIRSRYAIVLGTIFKDVVILTVRGTVFRRLWDWKANVDAKKYYVRECPRFDDCDFIPFGHGCGGFDDQFFHRGFFESIVPQFASIAEKIKELLGPQTEPQIVWTGHSLGGAMAAVGNAIHQSRVARKCLAIRIPYSAVSAYTFGMPRYCGLGGICCFDSPYHIYNKQDIVPTVPLRMMGYVDCCREYAITDTGTVTLSERTDAFGVAGHIPKLCASIKAHRIEGYASALARAVDQLLH